MHKSLPLALLLPAVAAMLSACATSGPSRAEIEAQIPNSAFEIHLYSEQSPDDYLGYIRRRLELQGMDVTRYSAVDQNLATASYNIGRQLTLAIYVTVTHDMDVDKTRAVFSGIQGRDGQLIGSARWNDLDDDQAYAFGRMAQIVNRIEHDQIVYAVENQ